jgi:hypothetical protein
VGLERMAPLTRVKVHSIYPEIERPLMTRRSSSPSKYRSTSSQRSPDTVQPGRAGVARTTVDPDRPAVSRTRDPASPTGATRDPPVLSEVGGENSGVSFSISSYLRHPATARLPRITSDPSDVAWFQI